MSHKKLAQVNSISIGPFGTCDGCDAVNIFNVPFDEKPLFEEHSYISAVKMWFVTFLIPYSLRICESCPVSRKK